MQQIMFIVGMKPLEEVPYTNRDGKADVDGGQLCPRCHTTETARGRMGAGGAGVHRAGSPDKGG